MSIAWDISHQEFTIDDHYYFSILKSKLKELGAKIFVIDDLSHISLGNVKTLVFNYPEKPFSSEDIETVRRFLISGGRVIVAGYYYNEDNIADTINSLTKHFGLLLNKDAVIDEQNNYNNDKYFVVTSQVSSFNEGVKKLLFACTASIRIMDDAEVLIRGENTARSTLNMEPIIGAIKKVGNGELILLGTCVFWDNYSVEKYSNLQFSLNILLGKQI